MFGRSCLPPLCAACLAAFVLGSPQGVSRAATSEPGDQAVSFELDIQPILTARGCNQGACHGKQRGQNGFQLSLLGFDSDFDFRSITRQALSRRINIRSPENSLLLRKATAEASHGGGKKVEPGSIEYRTLVSWIRQGAPRRLPDEPSLESVSLGQTDYSIAPESTAQLSVTATYSDGTTRNVTSATTYLSNDTAVAAVDTQGMITAGALPGETAIMARYMNHITVAAVSIPREGSLPDAFYADQPRNNFIDDLTFQRLDELGIQISDPADDSAFLRRAYTDVIGRLPTPEEAVAFLESRDDDKRERLVEHLLEQPEYADHWAAQWADLLRPNPYRVGIKAVLNYDHWIRKQFRDNVPYDEFVRQLVVAKGSTWRNGAATLYRDRRSPDEVATLMSRLFLGIRLECAKCHHHPFEKWSQTDFYSFAAFFGNVGRKGKGISPPISGGEEIVYTTSSGSVRHPVTEEVLPPTPLFGDIREEEDADPREQLARWMTSPDNAYFAEVQANRIWAALMYVPLVTPVDDLRATNPASNAELLAALGRHFRESGFDNKALIKTIVLSKVYSLGSTPNETNASDRKNYARHYRHRMGAEVLLDAVADVTETDLRFSAVAPQSRANQVWTARIDSAFLDTFGRPNENQDPPCERVSDSTVTQTLHLMNARDIDGRIRNDSGRAARLAKSDASAGQIVEELYLAVFSRRPSDAELLYGVTLIDEAGDERRGVIEDLLWAMINSPEFIIQN